MWHPNIKLLSCMKILAIGVNPCAAHHFARYTFFMHVHIFFFPIISVFSPYHIVDHAGVGLDELDYLGGYVGVRVVWDGEAEVAAPVHFHGHVHGLQKRCPVNAREDEVAFVKGLGALGGGADAHGCYGPAYAQEEA